MIDRPVLYGDAIICMGYGVVQGAVDTAFAPLAAARPELFTAGIAEPYMQGVLLATAWVGCGLSFGLYDPKWTRGSTIEALGACIACWCSSSTLMLAIFTGLHAIGVGPGATQAVAEFYTGSLTALGGWRLVVVPRA